MGTINPTTPNIQSGTSQTFSVSGIASPVWTLEGLGSLTQLGVFTAPGSAGSSLIRAHSSFWNYVNSTFYSTNADDTLTKNATSGGYYSQAKSNGLLNAIGDYVEFTAARTNPYWVGVENDAGTHRVVFASSSNPNFLMTYHPSGNANYTISSWMLGDLIRMEIISGGYLRVSVNGTVVHTTTYSFTGANLRFIQDGDLTNGTIIKVPKMSASGYSEVSTTVTYFAPLPYGFDQTGTELFCEANLMTQTNGSTVSSFTDQSVNNRHLTAASSQPTFQTGVINSKPVIRNTGSQNPLVNNSTFTFRCGWILAKYNGSSFPDYKGLLTDTISQGILVGNNTGTNFFDFLTDFYEFRTNDRIYPASAAPAPMNAFNLIFFRFWRNITVSGIQLFQDRTFTTRKWAGDVALLILASRNFSEQEIRSKSAAIAAGYNLTIADVYPYQADLRGVQQTPSQSVNFYDPPEGDRISEVLSDPKRELDLKFSSRRSDEVAAMKTFHAAHYGPALPCFYRNYNVTPPEDIEGYIDSPYELEGGLNNFNYSFTILEK
ncbi:MAG: hypothetical protein JSS81_05795 [Acidobacteria bacterium]|nr:hypothetical protein [Acidobacteriota bacterium]